MKLVTALGFHNVVAITSGLCKRHGLTAFRRCTSLTLQNKHHSTTHVKHLLTASLHGWHRTVVCFPHGTRSLSEQLPACVLVLTDSNQEPV